VVTGEVPYKGFSEPQVTGMLLQGIRPARPSKVIVDDEEWGFISKCWSDPPKERPIAFLYCMNCSLILNQVNPIQTNVE
jgi:hypothetical protein